MRTTHHEPEPGSLPPGGAHAALEPRGPTRRRSERGASLVEYALMVALVAVVCIGAVAYLGTSGSAQLDKGSSGLKGDDGSRCSPFQVDYNQQTGQSTIVSHITYFAEGGYQIASGPCP